jgi:hypothetical protein
MTERPVAKQLMRFAQRALDRATFEAVIVPALADFEHELAMAQETVWRRQLVYLRAGWGLLKAVALCSMIGGLRNVRSTGPAVAVRMLRIMPLVVAILIVPMVPWTYGFGVEYGLAAGVTALILYLPANVLLAIPVSFFVSLAIHRELTNRLVSSAIAGSIVCSALVFALVMEVVPPLNTVSRVHFIETIQGTHPSATLQPGLSEMRLGALNEQIANPPSVRQAEVARVHRQERFAFVALIPVLGLLGLALAGRWQSRALTVVAAVGVFTLYGTWLTIAPELIGRRGSSATAVWMANAFLLALAIWALKVRARGLRIQ